jgi:hypothetical protein
LSGVHDETTNNETRKNWSFGWSSYPYMFNSSFNSISEIKISVLVVKELNTYIYVNHMILSENCSVNMVPIWKGYRIMVSWGKTSVTAVFLTFRVFQFFSWTGLCDKHGSVHNPTLHMSHLNLFCISLFLPEHVRHHTCSPSLGQCWLCWSSIHVVRSLEGVVLPFGVVLGTLPPSCIRFLNKASLKSVQL